MTFLRILLMNNDNFLLKNVFLKDIDLNISYTVLPKHLKQMITKKYKMVKKLSSV